jgi:transcriptional regulator with XRE-family HTH domain
MGKSASKRVDRADSFGATLKFLRKRARLTQEELGRAVGYSRSYITLLERDRRAPDATVVAARFFAALSLRAESADAKRLLGSVHRAPALDSAAPSKTQSDPLDEAVAWYLERSPETALRLTNTLIPVWYQRGRYGQARQLLETVLTRAHGDDAAAGERLKALLSAAAIAQQQGDHTVASAHAESAMTLARAQDDPHGVADAFARLGWITFDRHDRLGALSLFERQLAIGRHHALPHAVIGALVAMCHVVILDRSLRALFEQWLAEAEALATAHANRASLSQIAMLRLGAAVFDGQLSVALDLADGLLDEARHALPDRDRGTVRMLQGEAYFGLGRVAEAREVWRGAHDLLSEIGDTYQLLLIAHHMARVDMRSGRLDAARAQFGACLAAFETQDNAYMIVRCLIGLAECDSRTGQQAAADQLLERATAIMRDLPPFLNAVDQAEYERATAVRT